MLASLESISEMQMAGITLLHAVLASIALLGGFVLSWVLKVMLRRLKGRAEKARTRYADFLLDALMKPATYAVVLSGLWLATKLLSIPPEHAEVTVFIDAFIKGGWILLVVWFAIRASDGGCDAWAKRAAANGSKTDHRMVQFVRGLLRVLLAVLGTTIFIQNLGYSVGSLLAGLGLGGAALALASKDLLSNVFGSVAIYWDRSFEVGDWVEIGDVEGNVEEVGLRNIKIRTFSNSLVTMPNSSLVTGSINNWTRMNKRRAQMRLHLASGTSADKIREVVLALRSLLARDQSIVTEDTIVNFESIDTYGFSIFIQIFTRSVIWKEHLEIKQVFLLQAIDAAAQAGVQLAFLPDCPMQKSLAPAVRIPHDRPIL